MLLRGLAAYVEQDMFDKVVEGVAEQAKKIKVGPGFDPDTTMGPLVSRRAVEPRVRATWIRA